MNAFIQQLSFIMKESCFLVAIGRFLFPIPDLLPYEAEWNGNMTSADGSPEPRTIPTRTVYPSLPYAGSFAPGVWQECFPVREYHQYLPTCDFIKDHAHSPQHPPRPDAEPARINCHSNGRLHICRCRRQQEHSTHPVEHAIGRLHHHCTRHTIRPHFRGNGGADRVGQHRRIYIHKRRMGQVTKTRNQLGRPDQ